MTENVKKRSVDALATQAGVERESTATVSDASEKFSDDAKVIEYH